MGDVVLVAYASRHGATREIAEAVGERLTERGLPAEVRDVAEVEDLALYGTIVLGSAVYIGRWMRGARDFVEAHAADLRARSVWLFSSGPIGDPPKPEGDDAVGVDEVVAATGAVEHHLFSGRLDRGALGMRERMVVRAVGAPEGDFRDWAEVRTWADRIAGAAGSGGA
jgi:menaquinone-dependent protoporphyrinogen oxidase